MARSRGSSSSQQARRTPAGRPIRVELTPGEIRILVQSLDNCLATCRTRATKPDAPCDDCDAARALKTKFRSLAP